MLHLQQYGCILTDMHLSYDAGLRVAIVDASVASDTKKSWRGTGMAAGGGGGASTEFRGRDKRLPP